jgi:KDO2-lipid IV(A) lauroyltransferase
VKSKIVYWLTYAGMWLVALLPFRALYALSDGLYFLMRHVVHYRKKVVRRNLRNSFPEKSETELMEIERKFYHYICDYMLEEVKMLRMSFEELCRRMKYNNKGSSFWTDTNKSQLLRRLAVKDILQCRV